MNQKNALTVSSYYIIAFMATACISAYIGIYFSEIGLSNAQIGVINAVMAAVALVSQPLIGTISDRSERKNCILIVTLLLSGLTTWLIPLAKREFLPILAATSIFSFFHSTVNPLSDTIAIDLANRFGFMFSRVRMAGSLGFAIMSAVAGKIFSSDIAFLFTAYFVFRMLAFGVAFMLPPVQGYKNSENQPGFMNLFKDSKLMIIYGYAFILSCTNGFFTSFNTIYSREVGISLDIIGIGVMIGSISQFPFMAAFDMIYRKFGLTNLFLVSGVAFAVRWMLYATSLNSGTIFLLWAIHGFNYVILYLCLTQYVSVRVPKELQTRGQMMNTIILMGISAIIGGYFGGVISTYVGLRIVFLGCSVLSFITVLIFFGISRTVSFDSVEKEMSQEIAA